MKFPRSTLLGLICLLLMASVMADFWGALDCDFVNYDDADYVTSNFHVLRGLTWDGVGWAFGAGAASNWHPLTWLSHMTDAQLYGTSPRGHHFTSLLLHALNAALLFLVLCKLTGAIGRSATVAALFALHPLRVESVVWISERKDVLSTFFWLLAVWMYTSYAQKRAKTPYVLSIIFFALGLMSKPMVVTLPFVLLLLDYWPLGRAGREKWGRLVAEKTPFFVLAAGSSLVTYFVQRHAGTVSALGALSVGQRIANMFISYVRYLGKTFWPLDLAILYPHPRHWPGLEVAGAVILLVIITAWVFRCARQRPYLIVGWLWFLGMLVPAIGLVQVGIQAMADRYSYLPIVGIFIMLAWGIYDALGASSAARRTAVAAGALSVAACALLTPRQVGYWRDSETLFKHTAAVTTDNYLAYNNVGFDLARHGKLTEAMDYYRSALQINSNYDEAHNNLGFSLASMGSNQAAISEYIKALSLNSNLTDAHNNLGNALAALGQSDAAMHEYQVALQENPHHAQAHNNYGIALATHGKMDEAAEQFRMAIEDDPNYSSPHSNLGNVLAMQGKWNEAIEQYRICLKFSHDDAQVHNNLGNVLAQEGRLNEAVEHYQAALKLKPQNPEAHCNLGLCLLRLGRRAEAAAELQEALNERPDYPEARAQLDALRGVGK